MACASRPSPARTGGAARPLIAGVLAILLVSACAGQAPAGSPVAPSDPAQVSSATAAAGPDGVTLVDFAATAQPGEAARKELDLVREVREDAGIAALIGSKGSAALEALDRIESESAQGLLGEVAAAVDAGTVPQAGVDPVLGQLASTDGVLPGRRPAPAAIDISLFADTGFTTSALLGMLTGLVERAADNQSGSIPRQETHESTADGLRQQVDLRMTTSIRTGGGRVTGDITMSATDRIFDAASGSFVALYTSTSTGHFDVSACPDRQGIAAGTYTFETRHELNDVATATSARSGAARSVEAPFRLINGDDAKLQRIEANLDLAADAFGPGSPGGPGPTSAFDWNAAQTVQVVMSPGGSTSATGSAATARGTGSERSAGAMLISSAMAQIFIREVGKEAESFWRSGKCIELTPSHDTRDVDPDQEIDLTVDAKAKFADPGPVEKPITAKFTGAKSLDPSGRPVDAPATFHFVAGSEEGDKGTIDLEQISNRGIGKRQVVYTVKKQTLEVGIRSTMVMQGGVTRYDVQIVLDPLPLPRAEDGSYQARGTVHWTTTITPGIPECQPKTYEGSFPTKVTARIDPDDATRVRVRSTVEPGPIENVTIVCNGMPIPFPGTTFLGGWADMSVKEPSVPIDGSADVDTSIPNGSSTTTITVRKTSR